MAQWLKISSAPSYKEICNSHWNMVTAAVVWEITQAPYSAMMSYWSTIAIGKKGCKEGGEGEIVSDVCAYEKSKGGRWKQEDLQQSESCCVGKLYSESADEMLVATTNPVYGWARSLQDVLKGLRCFVDHHFKGYLKNPMWFHVINSKIHKMNRLLDSQSFLCFSPPLFLLFFSFLFKLQGHCLRKCCRKAHW